MARLFKRRFVVVYPLIPVVFLFARTDAWQLRLGIPIALLGELIRIWANGYVGHVKVNYTQQWRGDAKVGQLITAGPYAHIRHPLYFGSLIIGLGVCIIVGHFWLAPLAVAPVLWAYRQKMMAEEALLTGEWPDQYRAFQQHVPRYWPTWRRYAVRNGQWSWRGLMASKEWKTAIWVAVVLIALYLRADILREGEWLWQERPAFHAMLVGLLVSLILIDALYELRRRMLRARQTSAASA